MRVFVAVLFFVFATGAQAKDVALILNDQDQAMLLQLFDGALKADGLKAANAVYFWQKLKAAPSIEEHKDTPEKQDEQAPAEPPKEGGP